MSLKHHSENSPTKVIIKGLSPPYFVDDIEMWKLSLIVQEENGGELIGGAMYNRSKKSLERHSVGDTVSLEISSTKGGNTFRIKKSKVYRNLSNKKIVNEIKPPF